MPFSCLIEDISLKGHGVGLTQDTVPGKGFFQKDYLHCPAAHQRIYRPQGKAFSSGPFRLPCSTPTSIGIRSQIQLDSHIADFNSLFIWNICNSLNRIYVQASTPHKNLQTHLNPQKRGVAARKARKTKSVPRPHKEDLNAHNPSKCILRLNLFYAQAPQPLKGCS